MTPLRGRDGHLYAGSDDGEGRCVRCRRLMEEHNISAVFAQPYTFVAVSQRERDVLARELAPSGMLFGEKR